jgi:hypothetical protein
MEVSTKPQNHVVVLQEVTGVVGVSGYKKVLKTWVCNKWANVHC